MSPPREIELKLEVPARNLPRLTAGSLLKGVTTSATEPARLVSVYYDTKKGKLRQQGLSLRVRRTGRRLVQTVKQEHNGNAALFARGEWEQDIDAKQPNLDAARNTPLAPLLNKKLRRSCIAIARYTVSLDLMMFIVIDNVFHRFVKRRRQQTLKLAFGHQSRSADLRRNEYPLGDPAAGGSERHPSELSNVVGA
jgi:adenylate cyclase class IV